MDAVTVGSPVHGGNGAVGTNNAGTVGGPGAVQLGDDLPAQDLLTRMREGGVKFRGTSPWNRLIGCGYFHKVRGQEVATLW